VSEVVAIIQARLGSSRLQAKVLSGLHGRPMLDRVVERVARIPGLGKVVVAVPDGRGDDPLAERVESLPGAELFRGPEDDVLARYLGAARATGAKVVMRVTADCPLLCPAVSARVLEAFLEADVDYAANTLERTYPRGLDTEVFSLEVLERAHRNAESAAEREHVTAHVWRRPERFSLLSVVGEENHGDLRWTVDTPEDLELARRVYGALYDRDPAFGYGEILAAFERHPEWRELNRHVAQKEVAK